VSPCFFRIWKYHYNEHFANIFYDRLDNFLDANRRVFIS
jgi:hypothetical protein